MPTSTDDDRRRMADYLTDHGPTHGRDLRRVLGWAMGRFWDTVREPAGGWFRLTVDGWVLTDRGEREGPAIRMA